MLDPDPLIKSIIDHNILETLVRLSGDGTRVEPALATSWSIDESEIVYIFELDLKARWHDGRPVTATDVEFTFSRLLDPDGQATLRSKFVDVSKVEVAGTHTVTLRLDSPRPDFLFALSTLPILPAHIFGRTPLAEHPAARAPVGSGPFVFSQWIPGKSITVTRNALWRDVPPPLEQIEYHIVQDNRVAFDLFRRGDLDIVPDLPRSTASTVEGGRLLTYSLPQFEAWIYNTTRPLFSRAATRSAVGMLIDRAAIRCSIFRCRADLIEGPWPNDDLSKSETPPLAFDPLRAKKLLESDGWTDRDGDGIRERGGVSFSFSLLLPDLDRDLQRAATVVQGDLAQAGIEMRITTVGSATYLARLRARQFDVAVISVATGAMFDPWPYLHSSAIGGDQNYGGFSDSVSDKLLDQLKTTRSPTERRDVRGKIQSRLRSEQPATFTFRPHAASLVRDSIHGLTIREGWFDERHIWRDGEIRGDSR